MSIEDLLLYIAIILIATVILMVCNWLIPIIAILLVIYLVYKYVKDKNRRY